MSGSCALNLCGIACGRLDLFYETGFGGPWYVLLIYLSKIECNTYKIDIITPMIRDVAAGVVIIKEAGGLVYDP